VHEITRLNPDEVDFLNEVELAEMIEDGSVALDAAHRCLAVFELCDSARSATVARVGYHALSLAGPTSGATADEVRDGAARHLALARSG
jgi:hypothetical protein